MIRLKRKSKAVTVLLVMAMLLTLWPGAAFTAAPTISGAQMDNLLAPNYIRVLVNFSEGIYTGTDGTSGTGAVSAGDFALTVAGNGGAVTDAAIRSINNNSNQPPEPGDRDFFFYIDLTGGPPSGTETVTISPAVGEAVYNGSGEAMVVGESAAFTLLDKRVEFAPGYPQAGTAQAAGSKQVQLTIKPLHETVTAYYVVVADDAAAPDTGQVMAGQDSAGQPALAAGSQEADTAGDTNFTVALPADATEYDAYVVIEDAAGNVAGPAKVEVRTPDASASPAVIGIAVKTQPNDLTYAEGEPLDLTGLAATLSYIGGSSEDVAFGDFAEKGITTAPAHGAALSVAEHHDRPVVVTYGTYAVYTNNLTVTDAPAGNVCKIVETGIQYAGLEQALAAITDPTPKTVRLLQTIEHSGGIAMDNKNITFDLNGFTLNVNNLDGIGLRVDNGANVDYVDTTAAPGKFNVTGTTRGVHVSGGGQAVVSSAKANTGEGGIGAYVTGAGKIDIYGDAEGYFGVNIAGEGISLSSVTVKGDARGILYGTYTHAGKIDVDGNSVSYMNNTTDCGAYAVSGGVITIAGDARGGDYGAMADGINSQVKVGGNVEGTEDGSGSGAAAVGGGRVEITGDATGKRCGVYAGENSSAAVGGVVDGGTYGAQAGQGAEITVMKNVTASGAEGIGVYAAAGGSITVGTALEAAQVQGVLYGAYAGSNSRNPENVSKVHIFGDVEATTNDEQNGFGAYVENDGEITIEGSVFGVNYLKFKTALTGDSLTTVRTRGEHEYTEDLAYRLYTDDVGKIRIKENIVPQPVCEIGEQAYLTLYGALRNVESGETVTLLSDIGYAGGVDIRDKDITFDLNNHTVNVDNPSPSGTGLKVTNGGLALNGSGTLHVCGSSYGVYASSATVSVTNAEAGENGIGVYAADGSTVDIAGNITAYGASGGGISCINSEVTIDGSIVAERYIKIGEGWRNENDGSPDPAKPGYVKYSFPGEDETAAVWVKDTPAPGGNVCEIVETGVEYPTLDAALAAVPEQNTDAVTIKLLSHITDDDGIAISRKKIALDLNGKTLAINNSAGTSGPNSGKGLDIQLLSEVNIIGTGNLHIASRMAGLSVNESDFTTSEETTVSITSAENVGVHADTECNIVINGNVTGAAAGIYASYRNNISVSGTVTATGNGANHAVNINYPENTVYVGSAVVSSGMGTGVYIGESGSGSVTVGSPESPGQVVGKGHGIWTRLVVDPSTVTVYGNVTGASNGIDVADGCDITVYGNVISTSSTADSYGVDGFFNSVAGNIFIDGEVEGVNGIRIHGAQSEATVVTGNVTASGTSVDDNTGVRASYAKLYLGGNVRAINCTGAYSAEQSEITVDGTISAASYIKVKYDNKAVGNNDASSTKSGYLQYSGDDATFVWVKEAAAPTITGIAIKTQPADLTYAEGEALDLSGLVVTLTYSDETTLEVGYEDFIYMGITADPDQGTTLSVADHHGQPIVVTCNGQTASTDNLTVTAASQEVTGIAVKTQPNDLTYTAGETLDLNGLVVTLTYSDESTLEVGYEDFIYMGITAEPAQGTTLSVADHHGQPIVVTCNGQTASTEDLTVTAASRVVTGIAVKTQPNDLTYTAGETLDLNGLVVTLTYSDEATLEVGYEDFIYMGITADPAHGTRLSVAEHHNKPVRVTCSGQTAATDNLTVTAASSGGGGGGGNPTPPGTLVTSSGNNNVSGNGVTLSFPAGAVENDVRVQIREAGLSSGMTLPDDSQLLSRIVEIVKNKSGDFSQPVTITMDFDKSKVDPDQYEIKICYFDEETGEWVELDSIEVNLDAGTVSGQVSHFTKFAVIATPKAMQPEPVIPPADPVVQAPAAEEPPDISGHWARDSIVKLIDAVVISGYPDGSFQPDKSVSRAEFTVMLVKALKLEPKDGPVFQDTVAHWAKASIGTAAAHHIISGYDQNTFGPDDRITREQAAVIIARAAGLQAGEQTLNFSDARQISPWALSGVAAAVNNAYLSGYPDNSFLPQGYTSRAEAAVIIAKLL